MPLENDDISSYERPIIAVDVVVFTIMDDFLNVLLIKRKTDPHKGKMALPGCFVSVDEDLEDAANRAMEEKIGTKAIIYKEQLYTFGGIGRDPRGRVVSVVYFVPVTNDFKFNSRISGAEWHSIADISKLDLAFDHKAIVEKAVARFRGKATYTAIAFPLLPKTFTIEQLRGVYEVILGRELDKRNFHKKMHSLGVLQEVGKERSKTKPIKIYKLKMPIGEEIPIFARDVFKKMT